MKKSLVLTTSAVLGVMATVFVTGFVLGRMEEGLRKDKEAARRESTVAKGDAMKEWCTENTELSQYDYTMPLINQKVDIATRAGVMPADPNVKRPWPPVPIIEREVKKDPLLWTEWQKIDSELKEAFALQDKYRAECQKG